MGVTTFTEEHTSPIAPARLFKALTTDAQDIVPKIMPQHVKNIELEGQGDVGSIAKTVFTEGSDLKYLRYRIDSYDTKNLTYKCTLIDGHMLDDKLESVSYTKKFEPSGNGGCVIKTTTEYHTKGDANLTKEEDIKAGKAKASVVHKVVDDYLLKNPTVCV